MNNGVSLRIILVSNWPYLRIRALWRIARSRHNIVGIFIRQNTRNVPLSGFSVKLLSRLPKGGAIAKRIFNPAQAERVAVWRAAHLNRVKVHECSDINGRKTLELVKELHPDIILTITWPKKFGPELLKLPRLGCVNCHPSLLPKHRGCFPIAAALLAGEKETGVTFHLMDEDYDTGDVLLQKAIAVEPHESGVTLYKKCGQLASNSLIELLDGMAEARLTPKPQDPEAGFETKFSQADGLLDWTMTATQIFEKSNQKR